MQTRSETPKEILSSDNDYIEGYFKICELYQKKRSILKAQPKDLKKRSRQVPAPGADKKALDRKIAALNVVIKKEEDLFWQDVAHSLSAGKTFIIEQIASKFDLNLFEKRVFLYFLFLEFFHITENLCPEDELLKIFDIEGSTLSRMRTMRYLHKDRALIKNDLLFSDYFRDCEGSARCARAEIGITYMALKIVSKMLNGEEVEFRTEKKVDLSDCEKVGYVKEPEYSLDDVMLKPEIKERIEFFLKAHGDERLENSKVFQKIKRSKGLNFLFYGPPGTGKSILAEAVASHLNKKMLVVECSKIINKWIGETEKAISNMFKTASENDLLLCLDEADSLLYSRTYAFQEHDIKFVNEMLRELERFEGVAVFTTNMEALLDEALERRIALKVKIDMPDESTRSQIWKAHIPEKIKIAEDVDFMTLSRRYNFAGGHIRNATLNAVRRIVLNNRNIITMDDFVFGAELEIEGAFSLKNRPKVMKGFGS